MSTTNADQPVSWSSFAPVRRVSAVFQAAADGQAAARALETAGLPAADVSVLVGPEGAAKLDASGKRHGWGVKLLRKLDLILADESEVLKEYDQWLKQGACVVSVTAADASPDELKQKAVEALQAHGGQPVHYWGQWTIEKVG